MCYSFSGLIVVEGKRVSDKMIQLNQVCVMFFMQNVRHPTLSLDAATRSARAFYRSGVEELIVSYIIVTRRTDVFAFVQKRERTP